MSDARAVPRWVLGVFLVGLALSITLSQAALALLVVFWLARLRDPRARAALTLPLGAPFLAFVGATLLSALSSGDALGSLAGSKALLLVLVFFALVNTLRDTEDAERFAGRFLLLMAGVSLLGVVQVWLCPEHPWSAPILARWTRRCHRAHGFYSIYMTLAGVLTVTLLATMPRLFARPPARRWWIRPAWAACGLGLLFTYTRGAWLAVVAGAALLAVLVRRVWVLAAIAVVVLALVALSAASGTLAERVKSLGDLSDATLRERLYMWQSGLRMVRDHPLTGVGPGRVKAVYPNYALPEAGKKATSHLHNAALQILAERGVLGLAAWLWIWAAFFARGVALLRRLGPEEEAARGLVAGSLAAIAGFLVSGLTEDNFGDSEVVMVAYAVMALPFVIARVRGSGLEIEH